mgnify:CR=1 FL=1
MKYLINAFWGFCMALADSVPGVSGGTIAFMETLKRKKVLYGSYLNWELVGLLEWL